MNLFCYLNKIWLSGIILCLLLPSVLVSCDDNESRLDRQKDVLLIRTLDVVNEGGDFRSIPVDKLNLKSTQYLQNGEYGKACVANAMIGYVFFYDREFYNSMVAFKQAENLLQYCDTMNLMVHFYLSKLLMDKDSLASMGYVDMAINDSKRANDTIWLMDSYLQKALILNDKDAGQIFLDSALAYNGGWTDVCRARFANFYRDKLHPDTVIDYVMPLYRQIHYASEAESLTWAYIRKNMPDSAMIYLQDVKRRPQFREQYLFLAAELAKICGDFESATSYYSEVYALRKANEMVYANEKLQVTNIEEEYKNEIKMYKADRALSVTGIVVGCVVMIVVFIWLTMRLKLQMSEGKSELYRKNDDYRRRLEEVERENRGYKNEISRLEHQLKEEQENFESEKVSLYEFIGNNVNALNLENIEEKKERCLKNLKKKYPDLTQTELNVIWLSFVGMKPNDIAKTLNVSRQTVYNYRSHIAEVVGLDKTSDTNFHRFVCDMIFVPEN